MQRRILILLVLVLCLSFLSCGRAEAGTYSCTLSVRCDNAVAAADTLPPETAAILPADGILLADTAVAFAEGESVFDVLLRAARTAGLHLEFEKTPLYGGVYVEGIGNLYAFDGGELSGWVYAVGGVFPEVSASAYVLADGDTVEWIYTCDLGRDAVSRFAAGEGSDR